MSIVRSTFKLLFFVFGSLSLLIVFVGIVVLGQLPTDKEIKSCLKTKMFNVELCETSKNYVRLNEISGHLQRTVVLTEDSAFWQHNGFDFSELQKSIETNLQKGKLARGGSTITQQLAKNLFLSKEKTFTRKGMEALITMQLERVLTKKQILEKYLNVVQFGKDLFGIKAASFFYFQKHPSQLDVVESAFLAMLLPSPEKYSKSYFRQELTPFARNRIEQIIERLYAYNKISMTDYDVARSRVQNLFRKSADYSVDQEIESINEDEVTNEESAW